jgi:hypothetical protein
MEFGTNLMKTRRKSISYAIFEIKMINFPPFFGTSYLASLALKMTQN